MAQLSNFSFGTLLLEERDLVQFFMAQLKYLRIKANTLSFPTAPIWTIDIDSPTHLPYFIIFWLLRWFEWKRRTIIGWLAFMAILKIWNEHGNNAFSNEFSVVTMLPYSHINKSVGLCMSSFLLDCSNSCVTVVSQSFPIDYLACLCRTNEHMKESHIGPLLASLLAHLAD